VGYAVDQEILHKGSSGGIMSALALYCLEKENMEFMLHSGMDQEHPYLIKHISAEIGERLLEGAVRGIHQHRHVINFG